MNYYLVLKVPSFNFDSELHFVINHKILYLFILIGQRFLNCGPQGIGLESHVKFSLTVINGSRNKG